MSENDNRIRVLIVDDHDVLRSGLAIFFETRDDLELIGEATNGEEAIELCDELEPDVVLMDLIMPQMDGVAATEIIREKHPDTQVIVLTSFDEEGLVQNAIKAGAISYLLKNVSVDKLASAIHAAHSGQSMLSQEATRALISATRKTDAIDYQLTEREIEVLELLVQGLTNNEIADALTISYSTVKKHVSNIHSKLHTTNRTEAVALAIQKKLVET